MFFYRKGFVVVTLLKQVVQDFFHQTINSIPLQNIDSRPYFVLGNFQVGSRMYTEFC